MATPTASVSGENTPSSCCTKLTESAGSFVKQHKLLSALGAGLVGGGFYLYVKKYRAEWLQRLTESRIYTAIKQRLTWSVVLPVGAIGLGVCILGRRRVLDGVNGVQSRALPYEFDQSNDRLGQLGYQEPNGESRNHRSWERWKGLLANSATAYRAEQEVAKTIKDCRRKGLWQRADSNKDLAINVLVQIPYHLPSDALQKEALIQLNEILLAGAPGVGVEVQTLFDAEGLLYQLLTRNPPEEIQELASQAYRLVLESLWAGPGLEAEGQRTSAIVRRASDLRDRLAEYHSSSSCFQLRIAASIAAYLPMNPLDLIGLMANSAQSLQTISADGVAEFARLVSEGRRLGEMTDEEQFKTWFAFLLVARRSNLEDRQTIDRILGTLRNIYHRNEGGRLTAIFTCNQPEHLAIPYGVIDLLSEMITHTRIDEASRGNALRLLLEITNSPESLEDMQAAPLNRPKQLLQIQHLVPNTHPLSRWLKEYTPPMACRQRPIPSLDRQWERMLQCNTGLPPRLDYFTGRSEELQELQHLLFDTNQPPVVVLEGQKGIGKSVLTDELIRQQIKDLDDVCRLSGRSVQSFYNGIRELLDRATSNAALYQTDAALVEGLQQHIRELAQTGHQVLVIVEDIEQPLPELITILQTLVREPRETSWLLHTTNTEVTSNFTRRGSVSLSLQPFSDSKEAVALFTRVLELAGHTSHRLSTNDIERIVEDIGFTPSLIVPSASLIARNSIESYDDYVALGSEPLRSVIQEYGSSPVDAYRAYLRNFNNYPDVQLVLLAIVLLDPKQIRFTDIRRIVRRLHVVPSVAGDDHRWHLEKRESEPLSDERVQNALRALEQHLLCQRYLGGHRSMSLVVQEAILANVAPTDTMRLLAIPWRFHAQLDLTIAARRSEIQTHIGRNRLAAQRSAIETARLQQWYRHLNENLATYEKKGGFAKYQTDRTNYLGTSTEQAELTWEYVNLLIMLGLRRLRKLRSTVADYFEPLEESQRKRRIQRQFDAINELLIDVGEIHTNQLLPFFARRSRGESLAVIALNVGLAMALVAVSVTPIAQLKHIKKTLKHTTSEPTLSKLDELSTQLTSFQAYLESFSDGSLILATEWKQVAQQIAALHAPQDRLETEAAR